MVNDLRKICGIEAYSPTSGVAELTARVNDELWEDFFWKYLETSRFGGNDAVFILSVSGSTSDSNTSIGLVKACDYARVRLGRIFAIVGKDYGRIATYYPNNSLVIPHLEDYQRVFPHAEEMQGVIWHCIVSHPRLKKEQK